ncbi:MAG: hypothetical protein P4M15_06685 [Alphaproteobacteria bacterium]|nr:hypothetical protein [Alphaproteobacteria bacterium]
MRNIQEILSGGSAVLEAMLREAFEAGKAEAAAEMRAKMAAMIDSVAGAVAANVSAIPPYPPTVTMTSAIPYPEPRAAPGTVKPTILRLIEESVFFGMSTDELIAKTGFKPNSVRGTVSALQSDNAIYKEGDRWFSAQQILAANSPEKDKGAVE